MPRDVRDQCAGFRVRPRSNHSFRGAMTTSTYVSRIVFDLILSPFKVLDMFSAYMTCMDVFTQIAKDVVGQGLDHGTLTFKDVFTQIAKDVVGQGLDHGTLTFKVMLVYDRP
ncbi:hypothetical protein F2Q69_00005733 [Brassica cretica]|uniref:Uncharacterized protein n=1 Tax=Brassica cretica TaxID=69181 RepID=A0A8S9NVS4_BRACR|nr:hypothetical protein F2Q69_00005733 [Brassica cretica]